MPDSGNPADFNDQFYDLDDEFIDDDEVGVGLHEEMGTELFGVSNAYDESETKALIGNQASEG